ncbi:hypothetical protein CHS0354_022210 [Potamilus streckersoni]|uniref:Uncharacterized protein n=1 Tax=Potamilus streckersoni TaxID=2493646 RepID=A0AAE0T392_9BIVA|nr:hypothetical protein CHS0354_022210 [Potamilus streckersoni]
MNRLRMQAITWSLSSFLISSVASILVLDLKASKSLNKSGGIAIWDPVSDPGGDKGPDSDRADTLGVWVPGEIYSSSSGQLLECSSLLTSALPEIRI